jgi:hypothetical protein
MSFRCRGPDTGPMATTANGHMDYPVLFLVAVIAVWGTVGLLLAALVVRETVDWWYRRRSRGAHHPTSPTARTVMEIEWRLRREAAGSRPPRVIVLRHRMIDASNAPITAPAMHLSADTVPHRPIACSDK